MCLDHEMVKKQANKIKEQAQKRGYIRVWKMCKNKKTGWFQGHRWKKGLIKAKQIKQRDGGWYAYLNKRDAIIFKESRWDPRLFSVKTCYAKFSWIKRLGTTDRKRIGIFTYLAFPGWDKGDMTIREFREMCKGA